MSLLAAMKLLIIASTVVSVTGLAMRARADEAFYMFRHPRLGLRAFVAMYVVVPAVALSLALAFEVKPGVQLALLVLSFSPVPPRLPNKQLKSGGEGPYVTGLLVAAALVSLVIMPIGLHFFGTFFDRDVQVSTAVIAKTLAITIAIPLALGLIGQRVLGARAEKVADVLAKISLAMLLVGAVVIFVMVAPGLWRLVGGGTLVALIAMIIVGLICGYIAGGPSPGNRTALALASAMRHPGVALGVVGSAFPDAHLALLATVAFTLLNVIISPFFLKLVDSRHSRH